MLTFQATIVEIPKLSLVGNSVKWYHFIMYAAIIVPDLPRPAGIKKNDRWLLVQSDVNKKTIEGSLHDYLFCRRGCYLF